MKSRFGPRTTLSIVLSALLASLIPATDVIAARTAPLLRTTAAAPVDTFLPTAINTQPTGSLPTGSFSPGNGQGTGEIVALRTRTSRTVATGQGHYAATAYPGSIHYQDAGGAWQPIDNTLVVTALTGYSRQSRANRYTLYLPADLSAAPIRVATSQAWVTFSLIGASGSGSASGSTMTYSNALPKVSVAFTALNDGAKETLTLQDATAPRTFSYTLATSPGLTAGLNAASGIDFVDTAGKVQFSFAPPFMSDSATPPAFSRAVSVNLSGKTVTLTPDPTWLLSTARKWPVVIDPTVTFSGTTWPNCYIVGGASADTNFCGAGNINLGYDGTQAQRTLLRFDVGSVVPDASQILNAELGLYLASASTANLTPVNLHRVTQAWTTGVTWNKSDGVTPWTTAGGAFAPTAEATNGAVGAPTGWYRWYPTQLVQDWVDLNVPNLGMILKEPSETILNVLAFNSTRSADTTLWPYLKVAYTPALGEQRFQTLERHRLTDRIALAVNVANGNLILHEQDVLIRGTGLDLQIDRWYNNYGDNAINSGSFGGKWVMNQGRDAGLTLFGDGSVAYSGPSGYRIPFTKNGDGTYTAPTAIDATLVKNADASYKLTFQKTGEKYTFSSGGFFISDVDKNGNAIAFAYRPDNTLASITDTQGRVTTTSNEIFGRIANMTDPAGRQHQYTYNGEMLAAHTDPAGKVTQYTYDAGLNLVQLTDPIGNVTKFTYGASNEVTSVRYVTNTPVAGAGPTYTFAYTCLMWPTCSSTVTDPNGNRTTYTLDTKGRVTQVVDAVGNPTNLTYTSDSNVAQYRDGTGALTQGTYDLLNNLTQVTLPTAAVVSAAYGDAAHPFYPTSETDPQRNTTSNIYDTAGNLTQVTDALLNPTRYAYNTNGTLASVTDAKGNVTTFQYDAAGNRTGITNPAPLGGVTYTYDGLSRMTSMTDGKGQRTNYAYDALDRLTQVTYADLTSVAFSFDAAGNQTAMTDPTGTTSYAYDALNRQIRKTLPSTQTISYGWDGAGNLATKTDTGGTVNFGYTASNLLASIRDPLGATTTFGYDAASRRSQVAYPNGVTISFSYNAGCCTGAGGQITNIVAKNPVGTVLLSRTYSYVDPLTTRPTTQRYSVRDQAGNTTSYSYDPLNRLTAAKTTDSLSRLSDDRSYAYDAVGNRVSQLVNAARTDYTYNGANELLSAGSLTYTYDANGSLTGRSDGLSLGYNAANFTSSITPPLGAPVNMAYTGLDQTERVQAGSTSFVYDLFGISQRAASSGTFYELRDNTGQLLSERGTSGTSYVLFDALGSTTGLTDASGNLVSTWTYDPWGNVLSQSGVVATPFLFGGTYLDQATGLYKMGARYYDPSIGRWTQPDAILGTVEHPTTLNRYLYANADPVDLSDPSGYWCNWFLVAVGVAEIIHGLAALWWGGAIAWWVYGIVAAASWNIILALMIATFVLATVPWWAGGMLIVWTGYYHIRHSGCF